MTELEKLKNHIYYNIYSEDIVAAVDRMNDQCFHYNQIAPSKKKEREALLREMFSAVGENPCVESPFHCDLGFPTRIGNNVFINHGAVFLDAGGVTIGDDVLIGPNLGIYTPEHAFDPELRAQGYEISAPITICNKVWIGGSVSILGGVTIGENSIIGAGSVVTHDIPPNVIAVGNPCRVLREITEEDKKQHGPYRDQ